MYVYQRRDFLNGCGDCDGRGGRSGRGGREETAGRYQPAGHSDTTDERSVAATSTENQIVEYTALTGANASQSSTSDGGAQNGAQFGPRCQG